MRAHGRLQVSRKRARLNNSNRIGKVDFLDPIHLHKGQDDPAARRHAPAHIAKSAAPRRDRNFFGRRKLEQSFYLTCRSCEDDDFRFMRGEPFVAAVCGERCVVVVNDIVS